jgi:signal transduction histidine kinase
MSRPLAGSAVALFRALANQGVTGALTDALKKRIRMTNVLSVFGAFLMVSSVPFDAVEAPRWMVIEDILGAFAYLGFPLLNRAGHLRLSRLLCLVVSDLIVLGNVAMLGPPAGTQMVFFALAVAPFALYELRDRLAIGLGVAFPVACFIAGSGGWLTRFQHTPSGFHAGTYYAYSAAVTLAILIFCVYRTSHANRVAEEALREDIARRERAERELETHRMSALHAAKMAALGEMSGNIAHEVNNPVAAILLRAQRLRMLADEGRLDAAKVGKAAGEIEGTAHRIARIVDALRSFARDGRNSPMQPESVSGIIRETVDLCAQRFVQHAIELRVADVPDDLRVDCRRVQVSQILLNLLANAHDAVEPVATRWVQIETSAHGGEVAIAVSDSGPGVPVELQNRIMEPFFTTKGIGKGTGLGLSVSKGLAEGHGGRLELDASSPATRFVLTLRRTDDVGG